jgi:hypothetical protein
MTSGADHASWICEPFKVVRVATNGAATDFPIPWTPNQKAYSIATGPDGNMWLTLGPNPLISNAPPGAWIARLTLTGSFTEFSSPGASRLVAGPDGNMWFLGGSSGHSVGRVTTAGAITEFPVGNPAPNAMAGGGYPSPLTFGSDGTLWYTESDSTGVGHFNPADDSVTQVPLGQGSGFLYEWGITTGLDGNIWVGISQYADGLYRITPAGAVTKVPLPGLSLPSIWGAAPNGDIVFEAAQCTCGNGPNLPLVLGRLSASGTVSLVHVTGPQASDGLSSTHISAAGLGPDAHVWFVTDTQPLNLSQPSQDTGWLFRIN